MASEHVRELMMVLHPRQGLTVGLLAAGEVGQGPVHLLRRIRPHDCLDCQRAAHPRRPDSSGAL